MKRLSVCTTLLFILSMVPYCAPLYAQPIDYSSCPDCSAEDIGFLTKVNTYYQGINGLNPSAPSTYNLIGNRKFSGTAYSITNSFFGENWYPIRTEKQTLTGTFHSFSISNYGDESDWNIDLLPAAGFEDFLADAIPYQRDNWYADADWPKDEQGHLLIECEITPDEHRYGNPWFTNNNSQTTLLHRTITAYGPFVREEAHGNHPEIHPCEQLWWKEGNDAYMVLLVTDDSNRFKLRADTVVTIGGQTTVIPGDYTARRVTTFAYQPWTSEKKQESEIQVAFELNPNADGYYVSIQAVDNLNFFAGSAYPDVREGSKYSVTYKGNAVLTVEESSQIDPFVGVSFKNVCFNRAKGTLQGYIVFNTAIGNGDGKEGFVALRIDKKNVGVNARPQIVTGDIANTWKPFAPYDDQIPFSDIISSDMYGKGIVDGLIDFNGNGKSDLFAKQGNRWMVLYDGKGTWQEIQTSSIDVSELRFGDVNGNGKTDILRVGPNHKVLVSYDGVGSWTELTDAGEQNNLIQVADFNGDHKTDLVYFKIKTIVTTFPNRTVYRGDMYVKYGGTGSWKLLNNDYNLSGPNDYTDNFRFGNFNGDNITDVFRFYNKKFNVYWNGMGNIKELSTPGNNVRMGDLLFATGIMMPKETDVIYVDPVSKKWTVFYNAQPGSLPLDVKNGDPSTVRFADIDADPATDLIAIDFVKGNPNNIAFPTQAMAVIEPSTQLKYVEGSLKRKTVGNKEALFYDQDVMYYGGTKPTRRRQPAEFEINSVRDRSSATALRFTPAASMRPNADEMINVGKILDVPLAAKQGNSIQITYKVNPETIDKPIQAAAITALPDNVVKTSTAAANDWANWQTFLAAVTKPNKKALTTAAPGATVVTKTISFDLHPLYSGLEGRTARRVEMGDFIEELNETLYSKDATKRNALFGTGDVFNIQWTFSLQNLNSGQKSSPSVSVANGKFRNSKISFDFPATTDPLVFTASASITDKFGNTSAEPLQFVFYNKEIKLDNPREMLRWLAPYLNAPTKPGYIWMADHWERVRAGEVYLTNAQFIARANYLAEDNVLNPDEVRMLLQGY